MCLCSRKEMERWKCHLSVGLGLLAILLSLCHAEGEELLFIFWKYGYLRLRMRVSTADWANLPSRCSLMSVQYYRSYSSYVFLGFICLFFWYPLPPHPADPTQPALPRQWTTASIPGPNPARSACRLEKGVHTALKRWEEKTAGMKVPKTRLSGEHCFWWHDIDWVKKA